MTKKRESLHINDDLSGIFDARLNDSPAVERSNSITINQALSRILRQLKLSGYRQRTIDDYHTYVTDFMETSGIFNLDEITNEYIYDWLASMNVSNQTKLTRLKCLKAFLGHCYNEGWFDVRFWRTVNVKVDKKIKKGADHDDVYTLLRLLDLTKFVELRDAAAILTMYQTGIRVATLSQLRNEHLDIVAKELKIDGSIIKNHEAIYLPIGDELAKLLTILSEQNDKIRKERKKRNTNLFLTQFGDPVGYSQSDNTIQKRITIYQKRYGLRNVNAHSLRRAFAKNLLNKGATAPLISKALGHSDIGVTTRYLELETEEVSRQLREYL